MSEGRLALLLSLNLGGWLPCFYVRAVGTYADISCQTC